MAERLRACALALPDVVARPCWGEEGFFHHPPGSRRRDGRLFFSIRAGHPARFSVALPRETYLAWFGAPPPRPRRRERCATEARHGPFAPHPVYAWNAWAAASEPSEAEVALLALAIREAYGRAVEAPA